MANTGYEGGFGGTGMNSSGIGTSQMKGYY